MAETVFSVRNLGLSLALLVLIPAFLVLLSRLGIATKNQPVAPLPQQPASQPVNVAEKILVLVMTVLAVVWWVNFSSGLGLNTVIFAFLFLGLLAHGSASRYAGALDRATGSISGIVLQFPFYAGIMGMMVGSGLAVLAWAEPDFVDAVLAERLHAFTPDTETSAQAIRARLDDIRRDGMAESIGGYEADVHSHAAPVFGPDQRPIGALAVAAPVSRMTETLKQTIRAELAAGARDMTQRIGGLYPPSFPAARAA